MKLPTEPASLEGVRLLIWDLDDTYWHGTLEEGGVRQVELHRDIVKELSRRGIVNSIASKNNFDRVRAELDSAGVWEYFVFPQIAYEPKGAMVRSIVESSQLRPETVMFIDDNSININEVAYHNPGVQTEAPNFIEKILEDARFKGKDDSELLRLKQYKVLEKKQTDRSRFADKNNEFLRASDIRVSFHYDVLEEFGRVHELVNRTNQLNFTKLRWPEDISAARDAFQTDLKNRQRHAAYIKCADAYGDYGICGFYVTNAGRLEHFLFSCRILNMGVEQFVYRRLRRPGLDTQGEVVSDPAQKGVVDWIRAVDDAASQVEESEAAVGALSVCIRGACELDQMSHYLKHLDIRREVPFPWLGWSIALPLTEHWSLAAAMASGQHRILLERLPGLHKKCLEGILFERTADAYLLGFSLEGQWGNYRHKPSGLIVPLRVQQGSSLMLEDLTKVSWEVLRKESKIDMSEKDWQWFLDQFEYVDNFNQDRFEGNVRSILEHLRGKVVIIIELNTRFGGPPERISLNESINQAVRRACVGHPAKLIALNDLIEGAHEAVDALHFERLVYVRLAEAVKTALKDALAQGQLSERAAPAPKRATDLLKQAIASKWGRLLGR